MKYFAVLNGNNEAVNLIVSESKEIAEEVIGMTCQEYNPEEFIAIGFQWDGEKFNPPPMPPEMIEDLAQQELPLQEPTE